MPKNKLEQTILVWFYVEHNRRYIGDNFVPAKQQDELIKRGSLKSLASIYDLLV